MELRTAIRRRRMVRSTTGATVDHGLVEELCTLSLRAPSAGFAQGVGMVVVREHAARAALAAAADEPAHVARGLEPWLSSAPVHVVPYADVGAYRRRYAAPDKAAAARPTGPDAWDVPYWWVDTGAVLQNLLLLATEAGLAAGFLGAHAVPGLAGLVGLPADVHALGLVTLGLPPDEATPGTTTSARRGRRPARETVHHERWTGPGVG